MSETKSSALQELEDKVVIALKEQFPSFTIFTDKAIQHIGEDSFVIDISLEKVIRGSKNVRQRLILIDIAIFTDEDKYLVQDELLDVLGVIQLQDIEVLVKEVDFVETDGILHFNSIIQFNEINE
ncbi:DUF6838 family protein [Bacillus thuringiensis]